MRFICLKAEELLQGDSLTSTTKSPGTHLIHLGWMKDWVNFETNQWFWTMGPLRPERGIGNIDGGEFINEDGGHNWGKKWGYGIFLK